MGDCLMKIIFSLFYHENILLVMGWGENRLHARKEDNRVFHVKQLVIVDVMNVITLKQMYSCRKFFL